MLESLPRLPVSVQGQIYTDLITILKQNIGNREIFCSNPSWHLSLFALASQLLSFSTLPASILDTVYPNFLILRLGEDIDGCGNSIEREDIEGSVDGRRESSTISEVLNDIKNVIVDLQHSQDIQSSSDKNGNEKDEENSNTVRHEEIGKSDSESEKYASNLRVDTALSSHRYNQSFQSPSRDDKDLSYSLAMKVYAILLIHAMDYKTGWRDVEKTLSQCQAVEREKGNMLFPAAYSDLPEEGIHTSSAYLIT